MEANRANTGYTAADFRRYRDGLMTAQEQHSFEKKCLEDPFVAEAYEGYLLLEENNIDADASFFRLEQKLDTSIQKKSVRRAVIWYYASAAILVFALGIGLVMYLKIDQLKPQQISVNGKKKVLVPVPKDERLPTDTITGNFADVAMNEKNSNRKTRPVPPIQDTLQLAAIEIPQSESLLDERIVSVESQSARSVTLSPSFQRYRPRMANEITITGKVLHAEEAIQGVVVTNAGYSVVSDQEGEFSLPGKPGDSLFLSMVGFEPQRIAIKNSHIGTLQLLPDTHALSEITVVGYGKVSGENVSKQMRVASKSVAAQPKNGWTAYEKYLMESARTEAGNGLVEVSCIVSETGILSDFETKGTTGLFEAAIRIVSNGSGWLPASQNGVNYASRIHFTIHFKAK
ncbi:energy transducer TonB [Dyadobacter sp. CY312]|uniref:energy transducer TonB n=1 Tax=Dyadobacter sp. CY312 TaxID=2907303 RepID=UPI001F1DB0F5|nr:energy transducer TonB [Dyadobacter sp. CY312]MCE7041489.1 hypothetical protein [Dyadobacter sp. CY312]